MTSLAVAATAGATGTARISGGNCMTAVGIPIGKSCCGAGAEGDVGDRLLAAPVGGVVARGNPGAAAGGA
mgnify:FL=1